MKGVVTGKYGFLLAALLLFSVMGCAFFISEPGGNEGLKAPSSKAVYHFSLGVIYNLNGEPSAAAEEFEKAMEYDPWAAPIAAELAVAYIEAGWTDRALSLCLQALSVNPDDVDLHLITAGLYMNIRNIPKAVEHYRKVLSLQPENVNALLYLGTLYGDMKNNEEALKVFKKLVSVDPDHLMGNYYLGKVHLEMKNHLEAEGAFKKTLSIRPSFDAAVVDLAAVYEGQGKKALAVETLRDYLQLHPGRINVRLKLADLYQRQGQNEDAERELLRVLRIDQHNREAHINLGVLYLERGRTDEAVRMFSELFQRYPGDHRFCYFLASAYEERKDYAKARDLFNKIPPTSDLYTAAQVRIATMLKKQGRSSEAIAVVEQAVKGQKTPNLFIFLASLYEEEKLFAQAEMALKDGLAIHGRNTELHYALGVLYEKTGRFDEAIDRMEMVLKIEPEHADALNFIGYSLADRGIRLDEAERLIAKALALKPGNGYITDSMGWVYFRQGKIDLALKYLQEAARLLPGDATIAEHLGDVLVKAGKIVEALVHYHRALALNPDNAALKKKINDLAVK